jgi:hypothetical protein
MNVVGNSHLTEILTMIIFVLFCFYSYVILQRVVLTVTKEYAFTVVR